MSEDVNVEGNVNFFK